MNTKHTPGPWRISSDPHHGVEIESTVNGELRCIALVYTHTDYAEPDEERDANARLMAAAPEMLEALESSVEALSVCIGLLNRLMPEWRKSYRFNEVLEQIHKTKKKAKGEA